MAKNAVINNEIYESMGERWYRADDDPVALLRAEHELTNPWVLDSIRALAPPGAKVLDVGCGAGFLANFLSRAGFSVFGLDASPSSLAVARAHDSTKGVTYVEGNATRLPFPDSTFDVVSAMDFLEHVENPLEVVAEISRVLKDQGIFFFHTFNRSLLSWLVIIKLVEWFIPNTPRDMHVLPMFIKPSELRDMGVRNGLEVREILGTRIVLNWKFLRELIFRRRVSPETRFEFTHFQGLGYVGYAVKTMAPTMGKSK